MVTFTKYDLLIKRKITHKIISCTFSTGKDKIIFFFYHITGKIQLKRLQNIPNKSIKYINHVTFVCFKIKKNFFIWFYVPQLLGNILKSCSMFHNNYYQNWKHFCISKYILLPTQYVFLLIKKIIHKHFNSIYCHQKRTTNVI